jgi:hypothetical protein
MVAGLCTFSPVGNAQNAVVVPEDAGHAGVGGGPVATDAGPVVASHEANTRAGGEGVTAVGDPGFLLAPEEKPKVSQ